VQNDDSGCDGAVKRCNNGAYCLKHEMKGIEGRELQERMLMIEKNIPDDTPTYASSLVFSSLCRPSWARRKGK